jgi:hypothetical protein
LGSSQNPISSKPNPASEELAAQRRFFAVFGNDLILEIVEIDDEGAFESGRKGPRRDWSEFEDPNEVRRSNDVCKVGLQGVECQSLEHRRDVAHVVDDSSSYARSWLGSKGHGVMVEVHIEIETELACKIDHT